MYKVINLAALFLIQIGLFGQIGQLSNGFQDIYGIACGIAGSPPQSRIMIEKFIQEKDVIAITNWLNSPFKVKNVYAAEAILRMHNDGFSFETYILSQVEVLIASKEEISYCQGCIYGSTTISKLLNSWKLE